MRSVVQEETALAGSSEEQRMLRDAAVAFCGRDTSIARIRKQRWEGAGYDRKVWAQMAELGWLGILIPEQYGGMGLGLGEMRAVAEELAKALVPEPLNACTVLAARAILHGDNESLKQKLLPQMAEGKLIVALAWQEKLAGLDFKTIAAKATRNANAEGSGVIVGGVKRFVAPAEADGYIVTAKDGDSLGLYYVAANAQGVSSTLERRADGTYATRVEFRQVAAEAVVATGKAANAAIARALDEATYIASAELYGVMSRAMEVTIDFLKTRVQFGRAIGTFQALQHRAADLYIQQALTLGALDDTLLAFADGVDAFERGAAASRLKSRASDAAIAISREAIRFFGAMGITDECDIGLYLKRSVVLAGFLGNGSEHRRRFAALSPFKVEEISAAGSGKNAGKDKYQASPAGTDWNAMSDEDFRLEVRGFFEREYPADLRYLLRRARWAEMREWVLKLCAKGWIAPSWPKELGGMGLSPNKQVIFIEERERWGVARHPDQGVTMIGPLLMRYGTEEQKQRFLPKIIAGEHVWCQGYSEPNAGSDLASLATEAVADGDDFTINGTKIWTSLAHDATHMFLLARTDKTAKRQAGISFFLLDLKTPGVIVRPIPNIEGHSEFCQEFLENVRIPKENLVGELNKGWEVAKTLLTFERLNNGSPRRCSYSLNKLPIVARERGLWDDAEFQSKFTRMRLDVLDLGSSYKRYADILRQGKSPDPGISMLKIWQSETTLRLSELMLETASDAGYIRDEELAYGDDHVDVLGPFYAGLHTVISSGSNDIQRNVLAKRVLGLG
jgi:alkylation response protein AidB-like acyl-CoA dehydrogenase